SSRLALRKTVLDRILPIPDALVIEADEYIFTLASALAEAVVLDQTLVNYRYHAGNLFQIQVPDQAKLRRKCAVLASLVQTLPQGVSAGFASGSPGPTARR